MKNRVSKVLLSTFLVVSSLIAEALPRSYSFDDTYSLIGLEGGYSSLDVEKKVVGNPSNIKKYKMSHGGVKIGAQTDNYRIFLSGRYYSADDFDYATTYGVELQYLLNVTSFANIYLGAGTGIINMRFAPVGEASSRTISDPYISGDAGMNIHLGKTADLEFGARIMSLDATNTIGNTTYTFDNMITGYASIIFKYKMD